MCPKGDDPITKTEEFRTIVIKTSASAGLLEGYFTLYFDNYYFDFPAHGGDWDELSCRQKVESMANVDVASCRMSSVATSGSFNVTIEFREFPLRPVENNIYFHDGNPDISHFKCDTTFATGATDILCTVEDGQNDASKIPGDDCLYQRYDS